MITIEYELVKFLIRWNLSTEVQLVPFKKEVQLLQSVWLHGCMHFC
jgi:hypothetical protein